MKEVDMIYKRCNICHKRIAANAQVERSFML